MTSEEATQYFLDLINDGISYDINDVKYVLDRLSIEDPVASDDALTILYSNEDDVINQFLEVGCKFRLIDRTEASIFLLDEEFDRIIDKAIYKDHSEFSGEKTKFERYKTDILYKADSSEGFWASISHRFASKTKGDVYALVQHSVPNRICEKVEIPTILDADSIPITAKINEKTKDINHKRY